MQGGCVQKIAKRWISTNLVNCGNQTEWCQLLINQSKANASRPCLAEWTSEQLPGFFSSAPSCLQQAGSVAFATFRDVVYTYNETFPPFIKFKMHFTKECDDCYHWDGTLRVISYSMLLHLSTLSRHIFPIGFDAWAMLRSCYWHSCRSLGNPVLPAEGMHIAQCTSQHSYCRDSYLCSSAPNAHACLPVYALPTQWS